jgi:uncharacterized protein (TIGR00106 family)
MRGESMLAEFSVVPIGEGESVSEYVAECLRIVQSSGVEYQLTPMATVLEGDLEEVMAVILQCHRRILEMSNRVITSIKIDDRKGRKGAMKEKIRSVQAKM